MTDDGTPLPNPFELLDPGRRAKAFIKRVKAHPAMAGQPPRVVSAAVTLMEEAYRSAASQPFSTPDSVEMVVDRSFTRQTRMLIYRFRQALLGGALEDSREKQLRPVDTAAVFFPPGCAPGGYPAGSWILPSAPDDPAGTKAVAAFRREGLFEAISLADGWAVGHLSEWGYELIATGMTFPTTFRVHGETTTADDWMDCMKARPHPVVQAVRALGLEKLEHVLTAVLATARASIGDRDG